MDFQRKRMDYCVLENRPVYQHLATENEHCRGPSKIVICGVLKHIPVIMDAAKYFGGQISVLEKWQLTKVEELSACTWVVDDFEEEVFDEHTHLPYSLVGPTALLEIVETKWEIPKLSHPLYCLSMRDLIISFTGFRDKVYLASLVNMVQAMGGKVRRNMDSTITHLVADTNLSKRYEYAAQHSIPIMTQEWVHKNWERRRVAGSLALDVLMLSYRYKPFNNLKICFYGFEQVDTGVMASKLSENGGEAVTLEHPGCTHLVVNDLLATSVPTPPLSSISVVCGNWFWYSVQCAACMPVSKFLLKESTVGQELMSPQGSQSSLQSGNSMVYPSKRQWLPDLLLGTSKARTHLPKFEWETESEEGTPHTTSALQKQALFELLHTEENYVQVLDAILKIKREVENPKCPLLASTEIKIIFGNVLPIQKLHTQLLRDLKAVITDDSSTENVGKSILRYISDMNIAYPAYVNFYEDSRKMLLNCMETNAKFNSYLQGNKELLMFGRQSLDELMIRPIQRLCSVILLLKNLLKTLVAGSPEYNSVYQAIKEIDLVLKHVNEDKRNTEKLYKIFDVFNKISSCPPDLVSANRKLLLHFEAKELTNKLSGHGDKLMFFLFTDVLEVAQVRHRAKTGAAVACTGGIAEEGTTAKKPYKHISLIPLAKVWRFVDIKDPNPCSERVFALAFRSNLAENYYVFTLNSDSIKKADLLKIMCQQKATVTCKSYPTKRLGVLPEHLLMCKSLSATGLTSLDVSPISFTQAAKNFANKAKKSVSKAFSWGSPRERISGLDINCLDCSIDSENSFNLEKVYCSDSFVV